MIVLDYTTRIAPSSLKAAGVMGVCRYLSPLIDKTKWKRITLAEYRELVSAGIQVTLNWEYDARDWLSGTAGAASHATQAVAQAKSLGYPVGSVIVGSCDFDITRDQYTQIARNYAAVFASYIRNGGYRPGVYGPYDVLTWVRDDGFMDAFWQAGMSTAWSGGRNKNAWPGAHLRQRGHKIVGGVDTDYNDILVYPLWGQSIGAGENMFMIRRDNEAAVYVYDEFGNMRWPVQNEPERDFLKRGGMPLYDGVSDALFDALTKKVDLGEVATPTIPTAAEIATEIIAQLKGE